MYNAGHRGPGLAIAIMKQGPKERRGGDDREELAKEVAGDFRKALEAKDDAMVLETMRALMDLVGDYDDEMM